MNNQTRRKTLRKVCFYYLTVCILILIVATLHPDFLKVMPFGGLDQWENAAEEPIAIINFDELKLYHRPMHLFADSINIFTGLLGVIIIMVPIRWVYHSLSESMVVNHGVSAGLFILPMVVATVIDIVQFSIPLAFALAGIFAGVRYRTTLKSLADAFFTFAAAVVGLAAGTRSLGIGLVLAIFFCITVLLSPPVARDPQS